MTTVQDNGFKAETETTSIAASQSIEGSRAPSPEVHSPYVPAKTKRHPLKESRTLIIVGACIAILLIAIALESVPQSGSNRGVTRTAPKRVANSNQNVTSTSPETLLPATQSDRPPEQERDSTQVGPEQIARTAKPRPFSPSTNTANNLGAIPPFDGAAWEPPPYSPTTSTTPAPSSENFETTKSDRDGLEKSSLVFVRNNSASTAVKEPDNAIGTDIGIGLAPGTRFRARLETAISSAVQTPVVAVIEYNYERDGEIIVPAGSKAYGRLESADRSGYVGVRFDSLMMPDGTMVNLEAAATDLQFRPLRGKVEGKNTGKNVIVRSLSGMGEVAAMVVGQHSLSTPFSEQDLLRERLATNIGQSSDQEVGRLAITERIVVSVPANTEVYVVLEKHTSTNPTIQSARTAIDAQPSPRSANTDELRQLLQLQRELNQPATTINQ